MEIFDRTKSWYLNSGIIISKESNENCGGVHSFYDEKKKEFGFIYPEITGYSISTLRFLYNLEESNLFLELAKKSSDWLISIYDKYGGIIQRVDLKKSQKKLVYTFDSAICAKGLLDCYLITKENKYLEYGKKLLYWIFEEALEKDGTIKPFKDLNSNQFQETNDFWYTQKGCLHIKIAIPFLQLYNISQDKKLLEKAKLICDSYNKYFHPDGRVSIHANSKVVHLHTLCYALEGLLYAYNFTKNKKYLELCQNSLDWCGSHILEDGSIHLWHNSKYQQAKTCYHVAQVLRLMVLMDKLTNTTRYIQKIENLFSFLIKLQAISRDNKVNGGFYEEIYKSFVGWKLRKRLNSWGTMFALQGIYLKENYKNISFQNSIDYLY